MAAQGRAGWLHRHGNVYLYVPNLIGYVRVVLMLYSFAVAKVSPLQCIVSYVIGFAMDELDGRFARMWNQTSTFGQVLDMVTDRISTTGLLALLCYFVPQLQIIWLLLITLDLSSHWYQMYAAISCGGTTHKDTASSSPIIKLYYTNRMFMGYCCVSCEFLYLSIYMCCQRLSLHGILPGTDAIGSMLPAQIAPLHLKASPEGPVLISTFLIIVALPGVVVKQVVNVLQLVTSAHKLVVSDNKKL